MTILTPTIRNILSVKNDDDTDGSEGCRIRVFLIKLDHAHIHAIVRICGWVQSHPDYEAINLDSLYYNQRKPVAAQYRSQDESYNSLVDDALIFTYIVAENHADNPDITWLCQVAENKIKLEAHNEAGTLAMLLKGVPLATGDRQIAAIMVNLQPLINKYDYDKEELLICRWVHTLLPEFSFKAGLTAAHCLESPSFKGDDRHQATAQEKVQKAFLFLDSVRDGYRFNSDDPSRDNPALAADTFCPEIEWLCDMAKKIIAILPVIGEELDCFADKNGLPAWDASPAGADWLCETHGLIPYWDDGAPRISHLQ